MSKVGKTIIVIFSIVFILTVGSLFFMQFSGTSQSSAFSKGEEVDIDEMYTTYEIGDASVGYINELMPFDCVDKDNGYFVYKNNNDYIFFIDLTKPHKFLDSILPGSADVYNNPYIKDLPTSLNNDSRRILNNLYNNNMKVEKYLIGEDNKAIIVDGGDIDGTLGHVLKQRYNIQRDDNIMYTFFSTNILVITMQDDADEIDSVSTYHRTSEN